MSTTSSPDDGQPGWEPANCTKTDDCPPRCPRFVDKTGHALLICPYGDEDFEALVDFYDEYPSEHRSMSLPPLSRDQVETWLRRLIERGRNIVAFDDGDVIGHVAYTPADAPVPELVVFVDEEYQHRGLGTELCRQALAYAAAEGHEGMKLSVDEDNAVARAVYRSLGFEEIGQDGRLIEMERTFDEFPVVEPLAQLPGES